MIRRIWNRWQTNRAFNALNQWDGYYKLPIEGKMVINRALDILRKAQEK